MSLHMPEHLRSIRAHQETLASVQAWWPATKQALPVATSPGCPQLCTMSHWNLTQELFAAMDERFPNNNDTFSTSNEIKTSETHPIK
jgi:hypothetical protein